MGHKLVSSLMVVSRKYDLDETMLASLGEVLPKKPSSRSDWDNTILKTFEEVIAARIAELELELTQGEPGRLEREAEVKRARDGVQTSLDRQQEAAAELRRATAELRDVETAAKVA